MSWVFHYVSLITCCSAKNDAMGAWVVLHGPRGVNCITWVGVDKVGFNWLLVPYQHPLLSSLFLSSNHHASSQQYLHRSVRSHPQWSWGVRHRQGAIQPSSICQEAGVRTTQRTTQSVLALRALVLRGRTRGCLHTLREERRKERGCG